MNLEIICQKRLYRIRCFLANLPKWLAVWSFSSPSQMSLISSLKLGVSGMIDTLYLQMLPGLHHCLHPLTFPIITNMFNKWWHSTGFFQWKTLQYNTRDISVGTSLFLEIFLGCHFSCFYNNLSFNFVRLLFCTLQLFIFYFYYDPLH